MSTKLITSAGLKLSNAGNSDKQELDCSANFDLATTKTSNGITYSAKAAENTLTTGGFATKGVLGPLLEVSKATGATCSSNSLQINSKECVSSVSHGMQVQAPDTAPSKPL